VIELAGESVEVDAVACAPSSELFTGVLQQETDPCCIALDRFPGGIEVLRSVVAHLAVASDDGSGPCWHKLISPPLAADTAGVYLEAAVLLRSPRLLDEIGRSPVGEQLSSRQALPLLEHVVSLTGLAVPQTDEGSKSVWPCGTMHVSRWSRPMEDALARAISQLSARLDPRDFRLGPPLARGSAQASLEVLRAYRAKYQEIGIDSTIRSTATLSVLGTPSVLGASSVLGSQLGERRDRVEWTEHQFALHVLRLHLERETRFAQLSGTARHPRPVMEDLPGAELDGDLCTLDEEVDASSVFDWVEGEDITEDVCDAIPDAPLACLADLAAHLDASLTPPVTAAVMVRAWLLVNKEDRADALFQAVFPRSPKVRTMVVDREIPVAFLRGVQRHYAASVTLRRMLARYASTDPSELCDLIEDFLFEELMAEEHAHQAILKHELTRHLILWMRSGGAPDGARDGALGFVPPGPDVPKEVKRLRAVGERLFAVAFTVHDAFLPRDDDGGARGLPKEAAGLAAAAPVTCTCPWDTGALDLPLVARTPPTEDALQLARRVLLRCVHRRHGGGRPDIPALARDWHLGKWSLCRDPALISEAFALLSRCWRATAGLPGLGDLAGPPPAASAGALGNAATVPLVGEGGRRIAEEMLFKMFTDLEVWRLPHTELLTPWVPGQVLAGHIMAQCNALEDRQLTLVEETRENLEEIARLHAVIAQLSGRLEATDARSQQCMQKQSDLNDTLRHLR